MKRVITYGTFDLFHYGHMELLSRARELGDYLVVGVSTDAFNETKGKRAHFNYAKRVGMLKGVRYVDEIIPEENWEQKIEDVKKHNIDVFVMGDDWKGKFDFLKDYCEVVYLSRTPDISSTAIRNMRKANHEGRQEQS